MEPITLVTGTPGAGKSLWTISHVEAQRTQRGLPVFYSGIPGLTLPWTEIQPETWHQVDGPAIVVIDEAHRVFPPRPPGSRASDHVAPFDQLRHKGLEVVLITQHPGEIDHYIRRRVGRHVHLERVFGRHYARTKEWQELGDPSDYHSCKKAIAGTFPYPKDFFGAYKSADAHTMQPRLPWKTLGWRLALPLIAVAIAVGLFLRGLSHSKEQAAAAVETVSHPVHSDVSPSTQRATESAGWAAAFNERVPGIPYSSPFYDAAVRPATFPKISGCIEVRTDMRTKCFCETQQGTRITTITTAQCQYWLQNGWFDFSQTGAEAESGSASTSSSSYSSGFYPVFTDGLERDENC
ncbi:MAG: hypothetical protein EPN60_04465 [Nevskiaceae bacterium]|nr:MAG: hypothetical protein EPO48_12055 [Nevskiaceae bacterium]TAM31431.1 MAG: hypothetical protein EPN60_04465 [Nevskiaceae bacterium]